METAQGAPFGGYDIQADAARIAAFAWHRRTARPWWDRLADVLAMGAIWTVAAATILLGVAMLLGAGWLVVTLVRVLWG